MLLFTLVFVSVILLTSVPRLQARPEPPQNVPTSAPKTAGEAFKNIQVLKDIPADQLIPSMQFISSSLGVECDFCHVEREFDKDDKKPKKTAREMMQMMFAINKNNFEGEREVTCNTCHRGSPHPQAIPAILELRREAGAHGRSANHDMGAPRHRRESRCSRSIFKRWEGSLRWTK